MRYQAIIAVRVWDDTKEGAEKQIDDIVLGIPNAFQIALSRLPHGSKISLDQESDPIDHFLISKGDH
tara:strand:- start:206 stop:406 length:201 start_codon:yes stop_codon:yes gene_type:complete